MNDVNHDISPNTPPRNKLEAVDYNLQLPQWSLDCLKNAAVHLRLTRPRSLAWAILLNALPTPNNDIIASLKTHRNFYNDLKAKLSMDPRAVIDDDPLSQNDESAWKQHFCDNELKALILQDVVRTFPDEVYFRDKDVQDLMVRVLFFWARSHSIGYRQGMHEILAPLLHELYTDRKYAPASLCEKLKIYLDEDHLEHDSYMLLSAVMKGLERFYTTGDAVPSSCGRLPVSRTTHNPNEVVRYLERVREQYLVPADPELAAHLAACNISMELFGIRWLRLLFGREFPRGDLPALWGFLFADGPMLPHVHYVIVAMLVSIRNTLLDPDAGVVLSAVMRPSTASVPHVVLRARHARAPAACPAPPAPAPAPAPQQVNMSQSYNKLDRLRQSSLEHTGQTEAPSAATVAEGLDVSRSLAALALVRARLPPAARALAHHLPDPPPALREPLQQILQLAAFLQCRNHALIDVETALEAAENQNTDKIGQKKLVPIAVRPKPQPKQSKPAVKVKEVQLKVFHQAECESASDLPSLDPLRLRTE